MKHLRKYNENLNTSGKFYKDMENAINNSTGKEKKQLIKIKKDVEESEKSKKENGEVTLMDLYDRIDLIKNANFVTGEDGIKKPLSQKEKDDDIRILEDIIEDNIKLDYKTAKVVRITKRKSKPGSTLK